MRYNAIIEDYRTKSSMYPATKYGDMHGLFVRSTRGETMMIVSSGTGDTWEHVSVSFPGRTPTWSEMCFVKSLFWGDDETVLQFHPKASNYVNIHPYCLHLWRKSDTDHELPPTNRV